ncbi:defensin-2-like [Polistes fuscatus]|uniref:defensin-2-like n=1 Tax=Polistes fuscatus TaxID=30207 RepID=UPI001CA8564A|nr:defensin-2-like [Polistes fuscatus]
MKTFVIILSFVLIAYVSASAIPDYDGPVYDLVQIEDDKENVNGNEEAPIRNRRFTCDLFSFGSQWVTPNHAPCAAKCLFKGRRGGTCNNGLCVCRH